MKSRSGILLLCLLCCVSCVSKKKYLALETAYSHLEDQNIRQYKTIDTLKWEKQQQTAEIKTLQRDTTRLRNLLRESRKDLEVVQNHLTSSKKELNEQIHALQRRDTAIRACQRLCQSYTDTLEILRKEAEFQLGLLIEQDSSYREVHLLLEDRRMELDIPEIFFFTPNNRNFISTKGKEMLKVVTELYQKYPNIRIEVAAPVHKSGSINGMKELMDRKSLRAAAICRSLLTEHQIPAEQLQGGLLIEQDDTMENAPQNNRILLRISIDMSPILEAIRKL
jgi:chemotaxis protein MotB